MKSRLRDPYRQKPMPIRRERPTRPKPTSPAVQIFKWLALATASGAMMLVAIAGLAFVRSGSQFMEGVKTALTLNPPEETVDVPTVVVEKVRNVSELTTAVFTMEAVVPTQSDRKLGEVTIGQTNLLYVAYGEVRAGIDLEKLERADVSEAPEGSSIRITLPPPEVLDKKIDVTRSNVYDYNRGFLNLGPDRAPQLQEIAQNEAIARIESAALCEQAILEQANERADLAITQLLNTAGFDNVTVETTPGDTSICQ